MNSIPSIVNRFQEAVRTVLPELADSVDRVVGDHSGNCRALTAPWPSNPNRCGLEVTYRGDCFEIAFFVAEARGPAEQQIIAEDPAGLVNATIDFLRRVVRGEQVVDVLEYHRLSGEPYYLAFFRAVSEPPPARSVDLIQWPSAT